jgi:cytochrome c553
MPANIIAQAMTRAPDDDIDDVARIKLYATRSLATRTQDARARLFGRILTTCAHCHSTLRDR